MPQQTYRHPKPRAYAGRELSPSVHWAQFHLNDCGSLLQRRIYDFELLYVIRGELQVRVGEQGEPFGVRTGDLLLLPSAIAHRVEGKESPSSRLVGIHFDFFDELDIVVDQDIIVQEDRVRDAHFCFLPVDAEGHPVFPFLYRGVSSDIVKAMEAVVAHFSMREQGYELACRGLLLQIAAGLLRHRDDGGARVSAYGQALRQLIREMEADLAGTWSNAEAAGRLNVSEDHYIRLFRSHTGTSPQQYIRQARHREARRLLADTQLPIERIGLMVGYGDLHNFSHAFKKWQGISPREYRKLCRMM